MEQGKCEKMTWEKGSPVRRRDEDFPRNAKSKANPRYLLKDRNFDWGLFFFHSNFSTLFPWICDDFECASEDFFVCEEEFLRFLSLL